MRLTDKVTIAHMGTIYLTSNGTMFGDLDTTSKCVARFVSDN